MKKSKIIICSLIIVLLVACIAVPVACGNNNGEYTVKKDTVFIIENGTEVIDIPIVPLLNKEASTIALRKNGTMTIHIQLGKFATTFVNQNFDATMLGDIDFDEAMNTYVSPIFPGFTYDDIPASLELMKKSLGLEIVGLDYEDPTIKALFDGLKTGNFPEKLTLPDNLSIEYNGPYSLKKLVSAEGKEYTALYMGKHDNDTEPFTIFTLDTNAEGKQTLYSRIVFLSMYIYAVEK